MDNTTYAAELLDYAMDTAAAIANPDKQWALFLTIARLSNSQLLNREWTEAAFGEPE